MYFVKITYITCWLLEDQGVTLMYLSDQIQKKKGYSDSVGWVC